MHWQGQLLLSLFDLPRGSLLTCSCSGQTGLFLAGCHLDIVGHWPLLPVQQLLCHLWSLVWLHQLWQDGGHRQHLQWPSGAVAAALHLLGPAWLGRQLHTHQLSTGNDKWILAPCHATSMSTSTHINSYIAPNSLMFHHKMCLPQNSTMQSLSSCAALSDDTTGICTWSK